MAVFVGGAAAIPGRMLSKYAEGDIVLLNEDGSPAEFYVAKHDYESGLNGAGRTLLVRKDCYDIRQWHTSDVNAYASSAIDSWLNSTYKGMLDANVQEAVGTTTLYNIPGNGTYSVTTMDRAVFLLSVTEFGLTSAYAGTVGSKLPIANILQVAYLNGVAVNHWTRNARNPTTTVAYTIGTDGNYAEAACTSTHGSRPCFTLPSTFLV